MKKIFFIILLAVILFLAGNIGEVEAVNGCSYSYYDVTFTAEDGTVCQDCWEVCIYEDGTGNLSAAGLGELYISLADLGTDRKTWLIWGDSEIACSGSGYINVYSRDLMNLRGEGVCNWGSYRVEGKKTDYCEGGG